MFTYKTKLAVLIFLGCASCGNFGDLIPKLGNVKSAPFDIWNFSDPILSRPDYDYGPAILADTGTGLTHYWWCSGANPLWPGTDWDPNVNHLDTIWYQAYNTNTGLWVDSPTMVLAGTGNSADWDGKDTCDPSVIKGHFMNPNGDGQDYDYALYYGGDSICDYSQVCHDPSILTGSNPNCICLRGQNSAGIAATSGTRIGVAFQKIGSERATFVRYNNPYLDWSIPANRPVQNPIISPTYWSGVITPADAGPSYGAGQPGTYNVDGMSGIQMVYTDTTFRYYNDKLSTVLLRGSADGIRFQGPLEVSRSGVLAQGDLSNSDFALDYTLPNQTWYATFSGPGRAFAGPGVPLCDPNNIVLPCCNGTPVCSPGGPMPCSPPCERDRYEVGLYKMPATDFPGGTWQAVGFVNTAFTGRAANHDAGIFKDQYGNVTPFLPSLQILLSGGINSIDGSSSWDIYQSIIPGPHDTNPLVRYYSSSLARHWATPSTVGYCPGLAQGCPAGSTSYSIEGSLGTMYSGQEAGTIPLYSCLANWDSTVQFISVDSNCEGGNYPLGIVGFVYPVPTTGTHAIYRCHLPWPNLDHFVSVFSNCEGQLCDGGWSGTGTCMGTCTDSGICTGAGYCTCTAILGYLLP